MDTNEIEVKKRLDDIFEYLVRLTDRSERLEGEIRELRGEVNGLRGEVTGLRTEMKAGFAKVEKELRTMNGKLGLLQEDVLTVRADQRDLEKRVGTIEVEIETRKLAS